MRVDAARPGRLDPPLRYSLAEFAEVIFEAFGIAGVRRVVEIGAEGGAFTEQLIGWCQERHGSLVSIDPAPSDLVRRLAARSDTTSLMEDTSHRVLPALAPADAYLIDGDHNFFTVRGELDTIHTTCEREGVLPLLVAQDMGWPAGRRDQYYDPASLPDGAVHPHAYQGVVPWSESTVDGGFRGDGEFAFARVEGGPANGVATAVEDFLASHPGYRTIYLPCIFGLALMFPSEAPWAAELAAALAAYDDNPLLVRLESNRILLYLMVIDLQDRLERQRGLTATVEASLVSAADLARTERDVARQEARLAMAERDAARRDLEAAGAGGATGPPGRGGSLVPRLRASWPRVPSRPRG
ncbi:MAG: class I SAM-dependent methyltransferase [Acidimicrobiales bacterium]